MKELLAHRQAGWLAGWQAGWLSTVTFKVLESGKQAAWNPAIGALAKQVELAAWSEFWFSHLGVVGLSPGMTTCENICGPCKIVHD